MTDFGLGEWLNANGAIDVGCTTNRRWVAPEVVQPLLKWAEKCEGPAPPITVSKASEVWMFGMLMLEVLTGQAPFEAELHGKHQAVRDAVSE